MNYREQFYEGEIDGKSLLDVIDEKEAEAQALREEVADARRDAEQHEIRANQYSEELAALRARAVVPDPVQAFDKFFVESGQTKYRDTAWWNFEAGFKLARLNGKAVSEGLLRRIVEEQPAVQDIGEMFNWQYARDQAMAELRALLGEGKES